MLDNPKPSDKYSIHFDLDNRYKVFKGDRLIPKCFESREDAIKFCRLQIKHDIQDLFKQISSKTNELYEMV